MKYFFIAITAILLFSTCKNDLKLNAPYKEVPSVYAVLNPQDPIQTIRINKVFLGEGDANQMAKVTDSVNYQAGELTVTLNHSSNKSIAFTESLVTTEAGAFSTQQRVYVTGEKLETSGTYTLTIKNVKTGNIFTAKSEALDSVKSNIWHPMLKPYYEEVDPKVQETFATHINYTVGPTIYNMRFTPNKAKIYQMAMRFHFFDSIDGNKTYKFVDYYFNNQYEKDKATSGAYNGALSASFKGQDIVSAVGISLSKMNLDNSGAVLRKMYKIQFFVYSSTQDYLDYLEFAKPSLNISQNKPLYSNFDNRAALGIFTFRSRCSVNKKMANDFITQFQRDKATCSYNFLSADNSRHSCP